MKRMFSTLLAGAAMAGGLWFAGSSVAQQAPLAVDAELVLAADASQSMDYDEHTLQRSGYMRAFREADVVKALTSGPHRRIAVTYVEWAGDVPVRQVIPWTVIDSEASAAAFAETLRKLPIHGEKNSSMSRALRETAQLIEGNAFTSSRQVIVLSGDGANAVGAPVTPARDEVVSHGIAIVGMPIMLSHPKQAYDIDQLDRYFERCVVGGKGAFVEGLTRAEQVQGVLRKAVQGDAVSSPPAGPPYDCLAGEKAWAASQTTRG